MCISRGFVIAACACGAWWGLTGCGQQAPAGSTGDPTGIVGKVLVGPQCPVQRAEHPCPDKRPRGATVTVAKKTGQGPSGRIVARATTNADGRFQVTLAPGIYVVTADVGMRCESVPAKITSGSQVKVDVRCDSGIR